ncbi:MAG TPA: hypothetical protein VIT21_09975 [Chthoniobacterales bacterium]
MFESVLPGSKPGFSTSAKAFLALVAVACIAWIAFVLFRGTSQTDAERVSKRFENLAKLNEANAKKMNSYAWVDKAKGTVQIPIDRAIDVTVSDLKDKAPAQASPIATPAPAPAASPAPPPATGASPTVTPTAATSAPTASSETSPIPTPAAAFTPSESSASPPPGVSPSASPTP